MADERETAPTAAGEILRTNIKRIREGQRLTFVEVSERLTSVGRQIPVLGLRRIERGERRVDVDDLFALAYVLGVPPLYLLIPNDLAGDAPYSIAPAVEATADAVSRWITGDAWMPDQVDPSKPFDIPEPEWSTDLTWAVRWMPRERAERILGEMLARKSTPLQEGSKDGRPDQAD